VHTLATLVQEKTKDGGICGGACIMHMCVRICVCVCVCVCVRVCAYVCVHVCTHACVWARICGPCCATDAAVVCLLCVTLCSAGASFAKVSGQEVTGEPGWACVKYGGKEPTLGTYAPTRGACQNTTGV